jgi:hypothetical protein
MSGSVGSNPLGQEVKSELQAKVKIRDSTGLAAWAIQQALKQMPARSARERDMMYLL